MKSFLNFICFLFLAFQLTSFINSDRKQVERKKYTIQVPDYMSEVKDLNDEADVQFQYVREEDDVLMELYLLVLFETHKEIKSYKLGYEFTALSYWELAVQNLVSSLSNSQIITDPLTTETVNGMECVRGDVFAEFGEVDVVYHLGVYKGKWAFYQVLTWTIADQRERFKPEMEKIVGSFNEK